MASLGAVSIQAACKYPVGALWGCLGEPLGEGVAGILGARVSEDVWVEQWGWELGAPHLAWGILRFHGGLGLPLVYSLSST